MNRKLVIRADATTTHFKPGDIIAGPLAIGYIIGRGLYETGIAIGSAIFWAGNKAIKKASPKVHYEGRKALTLSRRYIAKKFKNPDVCFKASASLFGANIGIAGASLTLLFSKFALGLHLPHILIEGMAVSAKAMQVLTLKPASDLWNKAEGSKGHKVVNPYLIKIKTQLNAIDTYAEDLFPFYRRTKDLLKKAPLTQQEEELVKTMPKWLRKLPKMERAGVIAHHVGALALQFTGFKNTTSAKPAPRPHYEHPQRIHFIEPIPSRKNKATSVTGFEQANTATADTEITQNKQMVFRTSRSPKL